MRENETFLGQVRDMVNNRIRPLEHFEGLTIVVKESVRSEENHNPSIKVYLENDSFIAEIGIWSSMTGEMGAINLTSGEKLFDQGFIIENIAEVNVYLDKVVSVFLKT
jgi:hypothetical protein